MVTKNVIALISVLLTLSACTIDANLSLIEETAEFSSVLKTEIQINLENSNVSNIPAAEFSVSSISQDVTGFYYKIGSEDSLECLEKNGYEQSLTSLNNTQSVSLSSIPDGLMKICIIAKDKFGKIQPVAEYSYATWTKDTLPPVPTAITHSPYYYPSVTASPTFAWTAFSEENTLSKYQIAIGTSNSTEDILPWTDIGLVTSYQATDLILSFNTVYYPRLRAIDGAGNISSAISNSGWYTLADLTAPASLTDMNFGSLSQTPLMKWEAPSDLGAGIKRYEMSIGTAPGLTDILGWIPLGNTNNAQASGLALVNGQTYYPSLRAVDNLDDVSSPIQNDGFIAVDQWKNILPTNPLTFSSTVKSVKFLSGGKRLIGGDFTYGNHFSSGNLIKLNIDGSRDTSHYPNQYIKYFLLQNDDKFIAIAGAGSNANEIYRANTNGTIDPSFESGPFFEELGGSASFVLTQQPNGKIVIGGNFTLFKSNTQNRILRLNTDGTFDSSFNIGTGFNNTVTAVASFSDNKLLASGSFTDYNGNAASCLIKLNTNGSIDNTFTPPTFNICPNRITIQPDGKTIVTGGFTTVNGMTHNRIIRLNTDGTIDAGFTAGTGLNAQANHTLVLPDGKIMVGGSFTTFNSVSAQYIVRLNADGTRDNTFNMATGFSAAVKKMALLSNGSIIVAGNFFSYIGTLTYYIALLDSTGNLDQSFVSKYQYYVDNVAVTSTDKIFAMASGNYAGDPSNRIAIQNADGTLDISFTSNIGTGFDLPADASVHTMAIQPLDNKIIVGGKFTRFNGTTQNYITRLNSVGTRDATFNIGTGFNGIVNALTLQSDNKIVAAGLFTSFNGTTTNRIARLNTDGTLDTSFTIGTAFNGQVHSLALQADGKIIAGGDFTTFNGSSSPRIVRINTDGSLDTSFSVGTGFNSTVHTIKILADQNILVGGAFTSFNGVSTQYFTKLATDGSKDPIFSPTNSLINAKVTSIAIQSDKKILIGGSFFGAEGNYLARLNDDGSTDSTFSTYSLLGSLNTGTLLSLDISSDGKILTGFSNITASTSNIFSFEVLSHSMLFGW